MVLFKKVDPGTLTGVYKRKFNWILRCFATQDDDWHFWHKCQMLVSVMPEPALARLSTYAFVLPSTVYFLLIKPSGISAFHQ